MAITVASSTNLAIAVTATPTINKPSGLAVGDLMVFFLLNTNSAGTTCTRTGWTAIDSYHDVGRDFYLHSLYRVADSADAAASNFAFTLPGSHSCGAVMFRVTGYTGTIDDFYSGEVGSSTTPAYGGGTGVTPSNAALLLFFETASINGTASNQAIANNNPSWTEAHDFTGSTQQISASWARYPNGGSATGNFSCTLSSASASAATAVAILESPVTVQDTLVLVENVKGNLGALARDTIVLVESLTTTIARAWSNLAKSVSTWLNQTK